MIKSLIKNKKAYSMSGWTEVALLTTLFMLLIIIVIANFNVNYDKSYEGDFGLSDSITKTQDDLSAYQDTLERNIKTGESSSSGDGISLSTTWSTITAGATIMWNFLTGGFIQQIVGLIGLPSVVGVILRILFVISIGFIIIKLILKVKP